MLLPELRGWIRYRGRVIVGVEPKFKKSHINDLSYRCRRIGNKLEVSCAKG